MLISSWNFTWAASLFRHPAFLLRSENVARVSAKTAEGYFRNVVEQVIRLQSKVWSNLWVLLTVKVPCTEQHDWQLFEELANTEITCTENLSCWLVLPQSNLFLKFQNNPTSEFWTTSASPVSLKFIWHIYYIDKSKRISVKNISKFFYEIGRAHVWTPVTS